MERTGKSWIRLRSLSTWIQGLELLLISVWAIWLGWELLAPSPLVWPDGGEFPLSIQSHFVWSYLRECGLCVAWNSGINGGAPAFIDLHGAPLHPVIIISSLLFGAINGAKLTVIVALAVAGYAQWWLARVLQVSWIPRMWGALLAVAGGHLAGRMEKALIPAVLATAFASLVIPAILKLAGSGQRRAAVVLGIVLSLLLVSGSGYIQLGVLFGLFPAALIFLVDKQYVFRVRWRQFLVAGVLSLLLAGVFLVPLLSAFPDLSKDSDPYHGSYQPVEYLPLNLVIHDFDYYGSEILQKQPYPYLYVNYIGWIPILLALAALRLVPKVRYTAALYFVTAIALIFFVSSGSLFLLVSRGPLRSIAAQVRNPTLAAGLAAPLILGLATMGLDQIITHKKLVRTIGLGQTRTFRLPLHWLVVIPLCLWSLLSVYRFSREFYRTTLPPLELEHVMEHLTTDHAQWVEPPFGEVFWIPYALERNMKIARTFRPWDLEGREFPEPYLIARRETEQTVPNFIHQVGGINIGLNPEAEYASIFAADRIVPCRADSTGGTIDVQCDSNETGTLLVREHAWPGWSVRIDSARGSLLAGEWLQVLAPAGQHHYEFRYLPLDLLLGVMVSLIGIGGSIWLWKKDPENAG